MVHIRRVVGLQQAGQGIGLQQRARHLAQWRLESIEVALSWPTTITVSVQLILVGALSTSAAETVRNQGCAATGAVARPRSGRIRKEIGVLPTLESSGQFPFDTSGRVLGSRARAAVARAREGKLCQVSSIWTQFSGRMPRTTKSDCCVTWEEPK